METHRDTPGGKAHIDQDEARAGSTPGVVRYVLLISITLAIVALGAIWITGAASSNQENNGTDDSHRAVVQQQQRESE